MAGRGEVYQLRIVPRNEHALALKVSKKLKDMVDKGLPLWYLKVHGGPFQRAGVWDYILCVKGRFAALELKHPNGKGQLSLLQEQNGRDMERAKAKAYVATSVEEVEEFVGLLLQMEEV